MTNTLTKNNWFTFPGYGQSVKGNEGTNKSSWSCHSQEQRLVAGSLLAVVSSFLVDTEVLFKDRVLVFKERTFAGEVEGCLVFAEQFILRGCSSGGGEQRWLTLSSGSCWNE